jgi:hypothetical protein
LAGPENEWFEQSANAATITGVSGISFMHFLPCLRCGRDSVGVSLLTGAARRENVWCLAQDCEAVHYLRIAPDTGGLDLAYDRYTVGYPLETFDDGGTPTATGAQGPEDRPSDDDGFSGFVAVYPQKRRFGTAEVREVWKASKGCCHLCGKHWGPKERGKKGWQIDHVVPLGETGAAEGQTKYRLACTQCTLGKSSHDRQAHLLGSIRDLSIRLTPSI